MRASPHVGLYVLLIGCFTALEVFFLNILEPIFGEAIHCDFLLVGVVYFALKKGPVTGIVLGFFSGGVEDIMWNASLGTNMLVLSTIGGIVGGGFYRKTYPDELAPTLAISFISLIGAVSFTMVLWFLSDRNAAVEIFSITAPMWTGAAFSFLLFPLIIVTLNRVLR